MANSKLAQNRAALIEIKQCGPEGVFPDRIVQQILILTYAHDFNPQQRAQFFDLFGNMPDPNRAVM